MGEYEAAIKDYTSAMQMSDDKVSLYNHRCGRMITGVTGDRDGDGTADSDEGYDQQALCMLLHYLIF